MKKNIGKIDRSLRIVVGLALILDGLFIPMSAGWRWGVLIVAGITLFNAVIGL